MAAIAAYSGLSILVALIDLYIAWRVYTHKPDGNRQLARCCVMSAVVALSYLSSILTRSKTVTSITSSFYFTAIDWVLYNLIFFVTEFTGKEKTQASEIVRRCLFWFAAAESAAFAFNIPFGFSIDYIPRDTVLAHFEWSMKPLYFVHLVFTYSMVVLALHLLGAKAAKTPRQYRRQFSGPMFVILLVVLVNAVFLFLPGDSILSLLDVSVCGYSVALFSMYWGRYYYAENDMLKGLSLKVFDDIDQALVLFDYDGRLIMQNGNVCRLLGAEKLPARMPMESFITEYCPALKEQQAGDNYILQCSVRTDGAAHPLRCDFSRLRDDQGKVIGTLFAFADARLETDLLTGFHAWDSFTRKVRSEPDWMTGPSATAVFDINNLAAINSSLGRDEGDRRLQALAESIRGIMPVGTYFVRGVDASLIAVYRAADEAGMRALAERIAESCTESVQYSVSVISAGESVLTGIRQAEDGLRIKKLLDADSGRSQLLTTLVQALQETDSDTEAHVQRTRRMGAALGRRLGLSDLQQGQLSLLCLLHDIGKIGIPLEILNKPGRLSDEEWEVLRSHVEKGYQIARSSVYLQSIAELILRHHERWDGRGYPGGLREEEIPLLSRIISVVDAYDAMVNDRSYRRGMTREKAVEELRRCAGSQFDPKIVSEFIAVLDEAPEIDGLGPAAKENSASEENVVIVPESLEQQPAAEYAPETVHQVRFSRYLLDKDNRIVQADDMFFEMTGYTREDILERGMKQSDLLPIEERMNYQHRVSELMKNGTVIYLEHPLLHKDGSISYVFCCGKQYYDSAARTARSEIIISDSTHAGAAGQRESQPLLTDTLNLHEWEESYRLDALTGLLNYEVFRNDVEEQILSVWSCVILLKLELGGFRQFTEERGNGAGDEYLAAAARALTNAVRKDDLACRMGGDEFLAALLFDDSLRREQMLRRVNEVYEKTANAIGQFPGSAGISMGAAISEGPGERFRVLYQKADLALYEARNAGGRLVVYGHAETDPE